MNRYNYILLDWDGNLAKTLDLWLDACRVVVNKRGIEVSDEQIGAAFGAFIQHMGEWGVGDPEVALVEADVIVKRQLPSVELYPDALMVLKQLFDSGKHLALITTSPHENVRHLLEKYDLMQFFEVIVAADDVTHHKPHPEPLEKAMEALGGNKAEAVMIGDSDKDLGAAHNYGIDSILFYPDEHKKYYDLQVLQALHPTHVVSDFKKIIAIV